MAQEFIIKSQDIEDKINQLLPSQGGFQPGVDFSASTMVIPIVDLTETAEGSSLRQDLQTALSHDSSTTFSVANTSTDVITTTGYYRIFGNCSLNTNTTSKSGFIALSDGATTKSLITFSSLNGTSARALMQIPYDFKVFVNAGDKIVVETDSSEILLNGVARQIADINGNLINP